MHRTRLTTDRGTATRRVAVTGLVGLDAVVVLLGTFAVWIVLGIAEIDEDVPDWIPPAAVAIGIGTAAVTAAVAVLRLRGVPGRSIAAFAAALHLGLAACTAVALGSVLGTATLLLGAVLLAYAARRPGW